MRRTSPADEASSYGPAQLAVRFGISVACLLGTSLILSHLFKSELEDLSRLFFDRFGAFGAAVGTWLADGFNFPVPPQAYMLLAEANGTVGEVFPAIAAGSLAGGVSGYLVAPVLMRFAWVRALVERSQSRVDVLCGEKWMMTSFLLSLSPIAFSWLCYSAALYRVPKRTFSCICLLRIPKLALYQQLVSWGWS